VVAVDDKCREESTIPEVRKLQLRVRFNACVYNHVCSIHEKSMSIHIRSGHRKLGTPTLQRRQCFANTCIMHPHRPFEIKLEELSCGHTLRPAAVKASAAATEKALSRRVFVTRKFCSKYLLPQKPPPNPKHQTLHTHKHTFSTRNANLRNRQRGRLGSGTAI